MTIRRDGKVHEQNIIWEPESLAVIGEAGEKQDNDSI